MRRKLNYLALYFLLLFQLTSDCCADPSPKLGEIPQLARWKTQMNTFGRKNGELLSSAELNADQRLDSVYYDGQWVFERIADFSGEPVFRRYAARAGEIYRDEYIFPSKGNAQGFRTFTRGLVDDFIKNGNARSKEAALLIVDASAYTRESTPLNETVSADFSREVAYAILAYLDSEKVGRARSPRLKQFVDQALGHLDQWFATPRARTTLKPFMVALTAQALIQYDTQVGDPRILPALKDAAEKTWARLWLEDKKCFRYADRLGEPDGMNPAPDLNLLIAPMYGWLYFKTKDPEFAIKGDKIFEGGVTQAFLGNGKQFNQNYRWSFDYVKWRE